jgi:hypothetical protein
MSLTVEISDPINMAMDLETQAAPGVESAGLEWPHIQLLEKLEKAL